MELLQKRFVSDMVIGYFQLQADILRRYTDKPISTNGLFADMDYAELTERHLDFITFDNYPNSGANGRWHAKEGLRDREVSYNLMKTRAISPIFGIMEQQTGPGGWTFNLGPQATPKPGQIRLWTFQAIAHGADYVGYFRWRTCSPIKCWCIPIPSCCPRRGSRSSAGTPRREAPCSSAAEADIRI